MTTELKPRCGNCGEPFGAHRPQDMARLRAALSPEALAEHLGPNGGGMTAITAALVGEGSAE